MKHIKPSKLLAPALLILSLSPISHADQPQMKANLFQTDAVSQILKDQGFSAREQRKAEERGSEYILNVLGLNPNGTAKEVDPFEVRDLSQEDTTEDEKNLLEGWAHKYDNGTLRPSIHFALEQLKGTDSDIGKMLKNMPPEKQAYAEAALANSIEAIVKLRGLTLDSQYNRYREWSKLSEEMTDQVDKSQKKQRDVLDLSGSSWVRTEAAEILVNGTASFAKRNQLMKEAKSSINILTWAIYDDVTGTQLADLLIAKKQENPKLEIRVMVDGQIAVGPGHSVQVGRLEHAGIQVSRWFNTEYNYVGQHRKVMIVDDMHSISGGLNFGDVYSHQNPDLKVPRWRDTDVYMKGAGAQAANREIFAKLWNDQLRMQPKLKYARMKLDDVKPSQSGIEVAVINNDPIESQKSGSKINLTILKAIREANDKVDIENAYIILFPALKREIEDALKRGVKVRVFTNSGESVDEPAVSTPILRSVSDFMAMPGAKVYTKKGATLHSKILVVDGKFAMVMSHNLHPRSERMEGEMAVAIRDAAFATNLHKVFDNDVSPENAYEPKSQADLNVKQNPVLVPSLRIFFDLL